MPIKLDCPRCNTRLLVPSKKVGGYVNCPQCKGRVWVDKNQPPSQAGSPSAGTPSSPTYVTPTSVAASPSDASRIGRPNRVSPIGGDALPATPAPPAPPPAHRRVARFIAADAADSSLQLAADGKLPELHLEAKESKDKPAAESGSNPLMLVGGLSVAAVLWIVLIFSLLQTPSAPEGQLKNESRARLEEYFGGGNLDDKALLPYQVLLRKAQLAHTRDDAKTERECYRKVLELLRAERTPGQQGLTGSMARDKELEEAINVLLEK